MKKLCMWALSVLFIGVISCRDSKKEQQELDATLDKIETVEQEVDDTVQELEKKGRRSRICS